MEKIREFIEMNIDKRIIIRVDTEKKRGECFECVIREVYRSIFIVELDNDYTNDKIRTFSYNDILSKLVEVELIV